MVRELYDKQKIREVVTRYCRGVDRMDRDLFLSAYHPDAIDDHGFVVAGPEAFWAWVHHYHTTAQSTHQHIITNHSCELDGNIAHAETYWLRSEEHTSELQSLMRISYAVLCLKKKNNNIQN